MENLSYIIHMLWECASNIINVKKDEIYNYFSKVTTFHHQDLTQ